MDKNVRQSNIMVIDDTPANLDLLEGILSDYFNEVRLFTDGAFAFESAISSPPDLILLDVMMPNLDGYEICRLIKTNNILKDIPVIFISARTETFDKVKAFKVGGIDYITKPFQIDEVLARVETHLKLRFYQVELREKNNSLEIALQALKEAQSQLVQSKTMSSLGTLTAGIAHEINNPVNAISSSGISLKRIINRLVSLLGMYEQLSPENINEQMQEIKNYKEGINYGELNKAVEDLLSNIERGSKRTIDIVRSLKTFTHMDVTQKEFINIHDNLDSTLTLLNHKLKDKIKVVRNYGTVPDILCFPGKINQVFMNILSNSIDAIEEKKCGDCGEIEIRTSAVENNPDKNLEIKITDNGKGIPPGLIDRIFEPFFTTKEVGRGTGLGLSISHGIIKSHSGSIKVESKYETGTTITILLPYNQNIIRGEADDTAV